MSTGENSFQTLGDTESKEALPCFVVISSCGDIIKDKSAGEFSPLRINHRTLGRKFRHGRNKNCQQDVKSQEVARKLLRNAQFACTWVVVPFFSPSYLFVVMCLLSWEWSPDVLSMISRRNAHQQSNDLLALSF